MMEIYRIDPLQDRRWEQLLEMHPGASVFQTPAWLKTLRRTYDYEPVLFSTSAPSEPIKNGIVFCRVQSWLTGRRLVSVPFADHCNPLFHVDDNHLHADEDARLMAFLETLAAQERCEYIELRLLGTDGPLCGASGLAQSATFVHHRLDLTPELPVLFSRLHKNCFQRKIRRAEKEGVVYSAGASDEMLQQFYSLLVITRRRHGVPPQPVAWFRNLRDCFGEAFSIHVASVDRRPVASILTLRFKSTVIYKYGGSDPAFHRFGSMPYLFWRTIQQAKTEGAKELDLGRSDPDAMGLIAFKDHMGAVSGPLHYYRHPPQLAAGALSSLVRGFKISARLPRMLFQAAGNLLYRHIG